MLISVYSRKKAHPVTLKTSHCNLQGPQTRGQNKNNFNKNTKWFGLQLAIRTENKVISSLS